MTTEPFAVYTKLQQARLELQSMSLRKTGKNTFAGYDYFELGDFLIPIQEIFSKLKLTGVVSFTKELATLTIVDQESGGQIVFTSPMGSAALKGCHEVQNIGAVETYQRRYLWVAALEIVEHDAIEQSRVDPIEQMQEAATFDELKDLFKSAYNAAKGDEKKRVKAAYDKRKAELTEGE